MSNLLLFDDVDLPKETAPLAKIYCDGGTMGASPSLLGGTWAWVLVNHRGEQVAMDSGVVLPENVGLAWISSNVAECWAALEALKSLPDGWIGELWTDSSVVLTRLAPRRRPPPWAGTPDTLRREIQSEQARLAETGKVIYQQLLGHPTPAELALGFKINDRGVRVPVSEHNVTCDLLCSQRGAEYMRSLPKQTALQV